LSFTKNLTTEKSDVSLSLQGAISGAHCTDHGGMHFAYVIHGCISVARGRMPEATMDVGEGRKQDAEASLMPPYGSVFLSVWSVCFVVKKR